MLDQDFRPTDPMARYKVSTDDDLKRIIENNEKQKGLTYISDRGWIPIIFESYPGAWQMNVEIRVETFLSHPTVYACVTQIASDIGKLRLRLTKPEGEIWVETEDKSISPILKKPNPFQIRQKFIESWLISKLTGGNTYVLKERNQQGKIKNLYILDYDRVKPLVSESGEVFYQLGLDYLSRVDRPIPAAPASEIIHDTMECLFHPLVGIPPMYAGSLAAQQGLNIQNSSSAFFGNHARPSGILTAPGAISDATATRLKDSWQTNYTGANAGKVAVLGDGLDYKVISQNAVDSQLVDQLKWSDEKICSIFKVPPYKVYVGPMPTYDNAEVLDKIYYASCLQRLIEGIEELLDVGLNLPANLGTEFDLDDLMRMDSVLKMRTAGEGVKAGILSPNEGRKKFSLPPVKGGETPYLQEQNYSLAALDERDKTNPLAAKKPAAPPSPDEDKGVFDFEVEKEMATGVIA
jgi:HK97 family phage portal protein